MKRSASIAISYCSTHYNPQCCYDCCNHAAMSLRMRPPPFWLHCDNWKGTDGWGEQNDICLQRLAATMLCLTGCHHSLRAIEGNDLLKTPALNRIPPSLLLNFGTEASRPLHALGNGLTLASRPLRAGSPKIDCFPENELNPE